MYCLDWVSFNTGIKANQLGRQIQLKVFEHIHFHSLFKPFCCKVEKIVLIISQIIYIITFTLR